MDKLPASFVDFAGALKKLFDSQEDVTKLVTLWDDLVNTDTPQSFTVELSNGEKKYQVDNLAKIREDIRAGLNLDEPTVKAIHFYDSQRKATIQCGSMTDMAYYAVGTNIFDPFEGWCGVYRGLWNDYITACSPTQESITVNMMDMPRIVLLGVEFKNGSNRLDDVIVTINPPTAAFAEQGLLSNNKDYTTLVTFVNRNSIQVREGSFVYLPVKLTLVTGNGSLYFTIKGGCSVTCLLFAPAGGDIVHVQEIKPNS